MDDVPDGAAGLTLLKYVILLASIPLWGPFARALWEEFVYAMRVDGGLWGRDPGPIERRELEERVAQEEPRQVHELLAHQRLRVAQGRGSEGTEDIGTPDEKASPPARGRRRSARPAVPTGRSFRR